MKLKYIGLFVVLVTALVSGCKEKDQVFDPPYPPGIDPLGIIVDPQGVPSPAAGPAGSSVKIAARGLMKHQADLQFLFNGEPGKILNIDSTSVTVEVPDRASSGVTAFVVKGQLVFGPKFTVEGLVNLDPTFRITAGANGPINRIVQVQNGNWVYLGNFTNFDNKGIVREIRRIVRTSPDGVYDRSLQSGSGATGALYDMAVLNGQWFIGGSFGGYAQRSDGISNLTRTSNAGQIDTMQVTTYTDKVRSVPVFNGGTDGTIRSVYAFNGKIIATGDFRYYLSRRYDQPARGGLKDSTVIDSIDVRQLARFNTNGTLDKTWRFDANAIGYKGLPGRSLPGGNGRLLSLMHTDGKILAYGQFNRFDDVAVGYIVRLNADGTIDDTFKPGTGADDYIESVSYDATTNKYVAVGRFDTFNGVASKNMVQLNYDGTIDQSFKPKVFAGGQPTYVKQLSDGLSVISGDFKTYDGVNRQGFLIVNNKGELATGYNTIGNLLGSQYRVNHVVETRSADNKRALIVGGDFFVFDNQPYFNLVRVTLEN